MQKLQCRDESPLSEIRIGGAHKLFAGGGPRHTLHLKSGQHRFSAEVRTCYTAALWRLPK